MTRSSDPPRTRIRSRSKAPVPPASASASATRLVRRHLLATTAGKLCLVGMVLQLPIAGFLAMQAFDRFPGVLWETSASLAFMHLCVVAGLFGCWLYHGMLLNFRNNLLQNALLALIALSPFFPTAITLALA